MDEYINIEKDMSLALWDLWDYADTLMWGTECHTKTVKLLTTITENYIYIYLQRMSHFTVPKAISRLYIGYRPHMVSDWHFYTENWVLCGLHNVILKNTHPLGGKNPII